MVFGELVDTVPIFGSQRKAYILIGALLMATGLLILAGAAGRWLTFARPDQLYVLGAMLLVSAPSFRTWSRMRCPRRWFRAPIPRATSARTTSVRVELGMVQVLGRLAVSLACRCRGLSGWLAVSCRARRS